MSDPAPFAYPGCQMRGRNHKTRGVCQLLQFDLSQSEPGAIAAATASGNQQALCSRIDRLSNGFTPQADTLGGKSGGIVIRSAIHPTPMVRLVVDAIRGDFCQVHLLHITGPQE